ncbi:MAG: preprotein translocase subunit YajC [Planctomycetaceae bacterium]|nr:preprotein translocase subunit YajC [Planctomycetaceae bacterium]
MWFPVLMMVGIFWLIVIGPERKQRKKREAMLSSLEKGQKVLTTSGIFGQVAQIQDQVVTVQVAEGVRMRFARHAIQTVVDTDAADTKDEKKDK